VKSILQNALFLLILDTYVAGWTLTMMRQRIG
jgi:hypothetical protein